LLRAMEIRRTPDCERFGIERLGSSGFGAFPGREREVARLRSTLLQGSVRSRFLVDDRVLMAANCAGFGRYSGPRCSRRVMVSLERTAVKTAVVALGKIGLPLAVQFADAGHEVVGVDVNPRQVELINQAIEPFPGEAHLQEKLSELVPAGRLRATTDYAEAIPGADAVVIVVPLFVNDATWEPDFAWMDAATRSLAEHLTPGTLVSYETTLPVGTLRTRFVPMIQEISGLEESVDFFAVFSPERVLTGRVFEDLRKYPKLIGALTPA